MNDLQYKSYFEDQNITSMYNVVRSIILLALDIELLAMIYHET